MYDVSQSLVAGGGATTIDRVVAACLDEAGQSLPDVDGGSAVVAGIGTTAAHALKSELLRNAFGARGMTIAGTQAFADVQEMSTADGWDLALVLSPWKQRVAGHLDRCTPSAGTTGVVDTIVRGAEVLGVNTNTWAAQAAMETLVGSREPAYILVLGSGASSYSVALACRRAWPDAPLVGSARSRDSLVEWSRHFDARHQDPESLVTGWAGDGPGLIVNTTTWGETEESESRPFAFDLSSILVPGNQLFDLNNRNSRLQNEALRAGMSVMSGTLMQRATNACRAALALARAR